MTEPFLAAVGRAAGAVARQLACLALLWGLPSAALSAAEASFVEVAAELGLDFVHGPLGNTPGQSQHGGGAVGDFNRDGWPDLFVVGGGGTLDKLFINQGDGSFQNEAFTWGLNTGFYRGNGAAAADYNGDGWVDLFVTSFGPREEFARNGDHRLYRNNGDGSFTEVAEAAGVATNQLLADGYSPAWGDYDLDGALDLWISGWVTWPNTELSAGSRLFRNRGDGTFEDVSEAAGVFDLDTRGLSAIFCDMDGDRYPELLVAGDFGTSHYFVNRGDGTFESIDPLLPGSDRVHNGMGATVADFDRDGDPDWFVTSIYPAWNHEGPPGNRLYGNRSRGVGDHRLAQLAEAGGVDDGGWAWGVVAIDVDHDGWQDIVQTNGWRHACDDPKQNPNYPECYEDEASYLFRNQGDGSFADIALEAGLVHTLQGLAVLRWDPDRDGDLDVTILTNGDRLHHYRNEVAGDDAHWLKVRLVTTASAHIAPEGIGARVTVSAGGDTQRYWIHGGSNYLSTSERVAHFGLGTSTVVDQLVVDWPDGTRTERSGVVADQELTLAPGD